MSATDNYIGSCTAANYYKVAKGTRFDRSGPKELAIQPDGGPTYVSDDVDDCAHFISCCLGRPPGGTAGGLPISSDFPNGPYGILSADRLFSELLKKKYIEPVAIKAKDGASLSKLRGGDLIFYWDGARYHHVAMYMADARRRITCHSYCRTDINPDWRSEWDSVAMEGVSYTFARVIG